MSKILIIGDTHLALGFPNLTNIDKWFKVSKEYFESFLFPLLKKELTKDDIIVHLGDLFDSRDAIPINILSYAQSLLERMSEICPVHILIGNHDIYTKETNDINTTRLYKHIPNVYVYDSPKKIEYLGRSILMLPWVEKRKNQIEILKEFSGCDYLFCHSDLNGSLMHLNSVAHRNSDKIDVEEFTGYKNVYSGHIHILQRNKNFTFVGNNFEMDRNDMDNQKGIFILDVIEGTEKFIPNNISPRFKKIYIRKEEDIETLDMVSTKDYIDLFISNSLLVNNRKLRRKLEIMLENGSFSSVDYIDDINIEPKKDQNTDTMDGLINESSDSISIELEFKEVIRNYISNQKYDNKVKNGILQEFDEVIRIYDDGYEKK